MRRRRPGKPASRRVVSSLGEAAAPMRAQIQLSEFKIQNCGIRGRSLRSARRFGYELRAFAAGGCGPPTSCEVDAYTKPAHSRADGRFRAARRCSPQPGGLLRAATVPSRTANSGFGIRRTSWAAACEGRVRADLRTRVAGLRGAKLRPAAASLKPQIHHSKLGVFA